VPSKGLQIASCAMDNFLLQALQGRGFTVLQKLQGSPSCSIFSVAGKGEFSAAKVVNLQGLDDQGRIHAEQEVSFLKGIGSHPNLIAYRDSFMLQAACPRLVIVMSLAEDGDLRGVVRDFQTSQQKIPEPVILSWLHQTFSGLNHIHSHSVMHRDLKTQNIFLSDRRRQLQIGDFGISRMLESISHAESCVGTPAYMAPEIMQNEPYDYHADMWALGCITYELCRLQMPFKTESLLELFMEVTQKEPAWQDWAYSQTLQDLARRLLSKTALERPSCKELLDLEIFGDCPEELWEEVAPGTEAEELRDGKATWSTMAGSDMSPGGLSTVAGSDQSPARSTLDEPFDIPIEDFQKRLAEEIEG